MICSRTNPMMRLKKIETPQIAEAMPMVRLPPPSGDLMIHQ
jgi:hypothetical protein